jgi:hypothetical protein
MKPVPYSPKMIAWQKRVLEKIRMGYHIGTVTLMRAKKVLRKYPNPELERLVNEVQGHMDQIDEALNRSGMGFWPVFLVLTVAGAAVATVVGAIGMDRLIKRMVPTLEERHIMSGMKVTAGVCLIGLGLYSLRKPAPKITVKEWQSGKY